MNRRNRGWRRKKSPPKALETDKEALQWPDDTPPNKKSGKEEENLEFEEPKDRPRVHFPSDSTLAEVREYSVLPASSSYSVGEPPPESQNEEISTSSSNEISDSVAIEGGNFTSVTPESGIGASTSSSITASAIEEQAHLEKHRLPLVNQNERVINAYAKAGSILYTKRCRLSDIEDSNELRIMIKVKDYPKIQEYKVIGDNLIEDSNGQRFQLVLSEGEIATYEELNVRLRNAEPKDIVQRILHVDAVLIPFNKMTIYAQKEHYSTLHNFMLNNEDLTEERCCLLFIQMVQIVAFMHEKGAVLRDISLRRWVFIDAIKNTLSLGTFVDMQLLKEASLDADDRLTERFGCAAYFSPEMLSRSTSTWKGRPADVWALGVCLFVMLTRRFPYYHITAQGLFRKIRQADLVFPAEAPISPKAQELIQNLLCRHPNDRSKANEILGFAWFREVLPDFYGEEQTLIDLDEPTSYTSMGMPSLDKLTLSSISDKMDDGDNK